MSGLVAEIERIRDFTRADPKLSSCHHFSFDFRLGKGDRAEFVVFGLNPGETRDDLQFEPGPTEESSLFDYRRGVDSRSRAHWLKTCRDILETDSIALTELIFWSSPTIPVLKARLGDLKPYAEWCRPLNEALFAYHQPRAIVAPGLGLLPLTAETYGLRHVETVRNAEGKRLIEHWTRDDRPWVLTKHWTGAFGFSCEEKKKITDYVRAL